MTNEQPDLMAALMESVGMAPRVHRLYGEDGDDVLVGLFDEAVDRAIDRAQDLGDTERVVVICEYTTHPPQHHMPTARSIVEHVIETAADNDVCEGWYESVEGALEDPTVLMAAETLRKRIADKTEFRMADKLLKRFVVEWELDDLGLPAWKVTGWSNPRPPHP